MTDYMRVNQLFQVLVVTDEASSLARYRRITEDIILTSQTERGSTDLFSTYEHGMLVYFLE